MYTRWSYNLFWSIYYTPITSHDPRPVLCQIWLFVCCCFVNFFVMSHRRLRRRCRVHKYFVWNVRNGEPEENVCIEENKKYRLCLRTGGVGWVIYHIIFVSCGNKAGVMVVWVDKRTYILYVRVRDLFLVVNQTKIQTVFKNLRKKISSYPIAWRRRLLIIININILSRTYRT